MPADATIPLANRSHAISALTIKDAAMQAVRSIYRNSLPERANFGYAGNAVYFEQWRLMKTISSDSNKQQAGTGCGYSPFPL